MCRTLFPRIKQSPYVAFSWPSNPYSCVCSIAIFKYPSRHAKTPLYSIPEFSFTIAGFPRTLFKKSDGDRFFCVFWSCTRERKGRMQTSRWKKIHRKPKSFKSFRMFLGLLSDCPIRQSISGYRTILLHCTRNSITYIGFRLRRCCIHWIGHRG
jgi:hypothetical protein